MTTYRDRNPLLGEIIGFNSVGSRTAYALDSNFTLGSAGKCLGIRFVSPVTDTIDDILFFVTAAPAEAHNLSVNVCDQSGTSKAGSAVANGTVAVSGGTTSDKWIKATYSSKPSLTVGVGYFIVIGDPAGAASNYSIMSRAGGCFTAFPTNVVNGFTSSDGFGTNGTQVSQPFAFVIKFTNGTYLGMVVTAAVAADSSADLERGWKITPDEDTVVGGITAIALDTGGSIKIYEDGQNPGGTIYAGFNGGAAFTITDTALANLCVRFPPCTLYGGTTYRIVQDPNGVAVSPGYTAIEDNTTHSAILEACGFTGMYGMQHTEEAAGPTWTDSPSKVPRIALIIQSHPAQAGDFPDPANVIEGDTTNGSAGTYHEATVGEVQDGVMFGPASEYEGTYVGGAGGSSPRFGDRTGGKQ